MVDLLQIEAFKSSPALVEKLQAYSIWKEDKTGSIILNENVHIRSIPIVTKGTLKVIRNEDDGRVIQLYYIKAGESCV